MVAEIQVEKQNRYVVRSEWQVGLSPTLHVGLLKK